MGLVDIDEHAHRAAGIPVAMVLVPEDVMMVTVVLVIIAVVIPAIVMARIPGIISPETINARGHQKDGQNGEYNFIGRSSHLSYMVAHLVPHFTRGLLVIVNQALAV